MGDDQQKNDATDVTIICKLDAMDIHANAPRRCAKTDWFFSPTEESRVSNVISVSTEASAPVFSLSAKVWVDFASPYDGGNIRKM